MKILEMWPDFLTFSAKMENRQILHLKIILTKIITKVMFSTNLSDAPGLSQKTAGPDRVKTSRFSSKFI